MRDQPCTQSDRGTRLYAQAWGRGLSTESPKATIAVGLLGSETPKASRGESPEATISLAARRARSAWPWAGYAS